MTPRYTFEIDGRQLVVIDDLLPQAEIEEFHARCEGAGFRRVESDSPSTAHIRTFSTDLTIGDIHGIPLFRAIEDAVRRFFAGEDLTPYRTYVNLTVNGDVTFPHRDCDPGQSDVTALYYVNPAWETAWGGETIFFNDFGDSVFAVTPRPGRLALFRGAIEHRTGVPTRVCFASRYSLARKYRSASTGS